MRFCSRTRRAEVRAKTREMEERVPGGRMEVMLDSEPRSLGTTEEDAVKHADPQGLPSNTQTPLSVTKTTQTRCEFALEEETVSQMQSQIENQSPTLRDSNRLSQTETQMLPQTRAQTLTQTQTEEFLILDQNGQPLRCEHMVIVSGQSESEEVFVIPSAQLEGAQVLLDITEPTGCCGVKTAEEELRTITLTADEAEAQEQSSQGCFTPPLKPLPSNAPNWALRLHNAEKIGDSYRGYCNTETELETILLLHKQQTNTVFGTRQSPSPAKPATRLMWKSQYVPYDGIPFVNAGSRAIVMECEFGPRRKGLQPKRTAEQTICHCIDYKATCPARIYIKKVRKFPQYRVPTDPNVDKKVVRQEQEKAFFNLRKTLWDVGGVLRYYMQLPTQNAHLYHDIAPTLPPPPPELLCPSLEVKQQEEEEEEECVFEGGAEEDGGSVPSRLHPQVADKIRELVEQGHDQVYQVRKQLRRFVEREMFKTEEVPERHNLCYFPTVNDIKNHIHEAQKTVQQNMLVSDAQWGAVGQPIMTQTVTLSLTPASAEGSLQRVGVLEGSDTFSPEAVQLFSSLTSLQPKVVAHLQGIQIPVGVCSSDPAQSPATSPDSLALPTPSCLGSLTVSPTLGKAMGTGHVVSVSSLGDGQLVSISSLGDGQLVNTSSLEVESSGTHNIVLENGQVIPVQVLDPATIALTNPDVAKQDDVKQKEDITVQPRD